MTPEQVAEIKARIAAKPDSVGMLSADAVAELIGELERLHSALQHGLVFYQAQRYLDRTAPEDVAFAAALIDLGYLERDHDDHNHV